MPITSQIRDGLLEAFFQGDVDMEDFQSYAEHLAEIEARLAVTPDRLTDLSAGNLVQMDADRLRRFGATRTVTVLKNKVKSAIVAPKPDQYGLARMFQTFNENPLIEIKIFRDAPAAYAWLGHQPPA
ncbi:MAG TPA: hypothetical protein VG347_15675 [Verrucomicrobiae bacterium]|nr:hypothetical protein [Verrucomicrobiae bacterium]